MQKGTIQQISEAVRARNGGAEQKASKAETEFLLNLRNDKTNADEAVIWTRVVLWVLTAFVVYLGYNYYLNTFSEMLPYPAALLFAIALPAAIEICKIKLATRTLRSWWFGWINEGLYASLFWGFVTIMAVGAFWWSYTISTGGIKEVAKEAAAQKHKQADLQTVIAAACSDVDARISAINEKDTEAAKMKTKKGNIAWSGQSIKMDNAKLLVSLQKEREMIVEQTTLSYTTTNTENTAKISKWASFIERFGGWGDIGTGICLIIISFFEKRLYDLNKAKLQKLTTDVKPGATIEHQDPLTEWKVNAPNVTQSAQNASASRPIGFRWEGYGTQPAPPPVSQPTQSVSQPTQQNPVVLGSNQILLQFQRKLMADIPNLLKKNGVPGTVSARINRAFDECYEAICHPDFCPDRTVGAKVYGYAASEAIPTLNNAGWPYERDMFFMQKLLEVIPKESRVPAA